MQIRHIHLFNHQHFLNQHLFNQKVHLLNYLFHLIHCQINLRYLMHPIYFHQQQIHQFHFMLHHFLHLQFNFHNILNLLHFTKNHYYKMQFHHLYLQSLLLQHHLKHLIMLNSPLNQSLIIIITNFRVLSLMMVFLHSIYLI